MTKQCEVIELNDILKRMGENCIERVKKNRINK